MSDRVFGALGTILAGFFIWSATRIELSFITDPVGPRTFPIIIGVVLGLASLTVLLRPGGMPDWPAARRMLEIAGAGAVMIAYALLLPELGFVISTAIASGFLAWRLGTRPIAASIAGLLIALGIYGVFHLILGLSLARGPLGF